ncbi:MAG: dicarboxylate/amino acid:cation symporter [Bacteroidales bacterium]
MKNFKIGLLSKVIAAIVIGLLFSLFTPIPIVRLFVTFNDIFGNFLGFLIPLIIFGLVTPGISELGKGAGKILVITTLIAYTSTVLSGYFSYITTNQALPYLIDKSQTLLSDSLNGNIIKSFFTIEMAPLMSVTSALVFSFVVGIALSSINSNSLKSGLIEFRELITLVINKAIIPILPFYIFGIFLKIGAEGQASIVLGLFFKVIIVIFIMHVLLLLFQYSVAALVSGKNPFKALLTMMPAYMTALGTQSSAATIPVTLNQTKKNGVDPDLADFVIPLCATIHLAGSMLKIVSCAVAVMYLTNMPIDSFTIIGFIFMLAITMVAAPGVPGGAIMASIGVLQSILGFDPNMIALMVALYITMDSFGTACNVTGDGAIAIIVNKINKK